MRIEYGSHFRAHLEAIHHSLGPSSVDVSWPKDLVPQDDTRQAGCGHAHHTPNASLVCICASTLYLQGGWVEIKERIVFTSYHNYKIEKIYNKQYLLHLETFT